MITSMVHRTAAAKLDRILSEGLKVDMPLALTDCGPWAQIWYEMNPVFLSLPGSRFLDAHGQEGAMLAVMVDGIDLVADLPSLCDMGGKVDDGIIWWKRGREPAELLEFLDEYGGIEIEHLLDAKTDACAAAIQTTRTSAVLMDISPSRITLLKVGEFTV